MHWRRGKTNPKRKKQNPVKRPALEMVNLPSGVAREEDRKVPHQASYIARNRKDKENKHVILSTHSH